MWTSSRRQRLGVGGRPYWVDLDLAPIIGLRDALGIHGPRHVHLAQSALDEGWIDDVFAFVEGLEAERTVLIAEGLVYYLPWPEVDRLFRKLRCRLPRAVVVFDVIGALDFPVASGYGQRVGAPVQWAVAPPFEGAMREFGLEEISGLGPDQILHDALQKASPWVRPVLNAMTYVKAMRER